MTQRKVGLLLFTVGTIAIAVVVLSKHKQAATTQQLQVSTQRPVQQVEVPPRQAPQQSEGETAVGARAAAPDPEQPLTSAQKKVLSDLADAKAKTPIIDEHDFPAWTVQRVCNHFVQTLPNSRGYFDMETARAIYQGGVFQNAWLLNGRALSYTDTDRQNAEQPHMQLVVVCQDKGDCTCGAWRSQ
jgi:hypothetical protein